MLDCEKPYISIVIPAYNEEKRLPAYLQEIIEFASRSDYRYEVIVVDDGSGDGTSTCVESLMHTQQGLCLIRLRANRGKGYAVKRGLFKAKGAIRLFMDADGSVSPGEIEKHIGKLEEGYDVLIGSRVLRAPHQELRRRWYRIALGMVFNSIVKFVLGLPFRDTQCGFKMFRDYAVKPIFSRVYLKRFGFDIELMFLVYKCGFRAIEVPVSWAHKPGSKVHLFKDSLVMLVNIFQIRNWHWTPINAKGKYLGPDEHRFMYELEKVHWWFTSRREMLKRIILSLRRSNISILDVGCGTGANLEMLGRLGSAYGVDASDRAVAFCRKRKLVNVICAEADRMPYERDTFDIVTVTDVLEHLEDPSNALTNIRQVMKKNGQLIVTVPAFGFLWSQHDEALCHFRRYSAHDLRVALEDEDFTVERMGFLFFTSFFAVAPIRLLRRLLWAKAGRKSDTTTCPPKLLNTLLHHLAVAEFTLSRYIPLPFGTSLLAVARRNK